MNNHQNKVCMVCERDENQVPLLKVDFKGNDYYICPQHIPVLIHDPGKLAGKLPGADELQAG